MRVVVDTNVLVAGLLSPHGPCAQVVGMLVGGHLTLLLATRILCEYGDVLRRPRFGFADTQVGALLDYFLHVGEQVAAAPLAPDAVGDAGDLPFLEVAVSGRAAVLVTGNRRRFPPTPCRQVQILAPTDFLDHYRDNLS